MATSERPPAISLHPLLVQAEAACARYDHRVGNTLARDALEQGLSRGDADLTARAQALLSRLGVATGDTESAVRYGEKALAHAARQGPPEFVVSVCNALSFAYCNAGLHSLAVEHGLRALDAARECADRPGEALALNRLGFAIRGSDESARAIDMLTESVRLSRTLPEPDAAFWPLNNLASRWIDEADRLANLGRDAQPALQAAWEQICQARVIAQASGMKMPLAFVDANLAGIHRRRGEFDEARRHFASAIEIVQAAGASHHESTFRLALASLEVEAAPSADRCGALEDALQSFTGADPFLPLRARRVLARGWHALGDGERAYRHLDTLLTETLADAGRRADVQWRLMNTREELARERHVGDLARLELDLQRARAEAEAQLARVLGAHRDRLEGEVAARTADLQRALSAAEAANRAKSAFLSLVSHELRTPLNGVIGMVEVARRRSTDERMTSQLDKSLAAGRQLSQLVDRLLEFVAEPVASALVDTDLRGLIDDLSVAVYPAAMAKGLVLDAQVADDVPARLRIEAALVQRVLQALLDNALKFSLQGKVAIAATWKGSAPGQGVLTLEVIDQGPGMAPEMASHLFRPFEMGDASSTRAHGGLGIGLALVFRWVQSMGGRIEVDSVPGSGSTFRVTLPAAAAHTNRAQA